jgi:hypothetical protein
VLKQSTVYSITFFMVSSADHLAAKTASAPVVNISKAGAAFGAAAGAVTEIANGWYKCALTAADTNTLGELAFHITGTGADDTDFREQVFVATVDDIAAYIDTEVAAIKAKTDQLTFTTANKVDSTIQAAGDFAQGAADKVWATAARSLTDKVGFALSAAGVQAIWDALTAALTTVGSIGKRLADDIDATISSRSTYAGGAVASVTAAVTVGTNNDKTGYTLSVAGIQAIWDALTAALTTPNSIGKLIVDNLNATITSVKALLPAALVGGRMDSSVGAMQAGVITSAAHAVGAVDALALATDATVEIADSILDRDLGAGSDTGSPVKRTVRQALRALRNKSSIAAGTLTVTKEDDATASWTAAVTTAAGNPISSIDPA